MLCMSDKCFSLDITNLTDNDLMGVFVGPSHPCLLLSTRHHKYAQCAVFLSAQLPQLITICHMPA